MKLFPLSWIRTWLASGMSKNVIKRLEGITEDLNMGGDCDICNKRMPPSGGLVTARAMRLLVEKGFDPLEAMGFGLVTPDEMLKQGFDFDADLKATMRAKYLAEEFGDFGVCPNCFRSICKFCSKSS